MHPLVNIAIDAARKAGHIIIQGSEQLEKLTITQKGTNDFCTDIDRHAERAIISTIHKAYPSHAILGEEGGEISGEDDIQWIIDPLDGTNNFVHGYPHYCVSIAIRVKGRIEHGVIYDPMRQDLYTCTRGAGASLNDRRIRVSKRQQITSALLSTGITYKQKQQHMQNHLQLLQNLWSQDATMRSGGAAALDLALVASGRLDGFWQRGINLWDIAAGALMVREAGGFVSDTDGGDKYLESGNIIAANPKLYKCLIKEVQPAYR